MSSALPAAAAAAANGTPQSAADRIWETIDKDVERLLKIANRAPNKSVRKLFDLMVAFVTEPENASARNIRDAKITNLKVPPKGRKAILECVAYETNEDFDTVFVVDPRATVLLAAWVKDLARIAKGKEKEFDDEAIKNQSRLVMEVSAAVAIPKSASFLHSCFGLCPHRACSVMRLPCGSLALLLFRSVRSCTSVLRGRRGRNKGNIGQANSNLLSIDDGGLKLSCLRHASTTLQCNATGRQPRLSRRWR